MGFQPFMMSWSDHVYRCLFSSCSLLKKYLVYIVFGLQFINDIGFIDLSMYGIINDTDLDSRNFLPVLLDRGDAIFKMLLDSRSNLSCLPYKQELSLAFIEDKDSPPMLRVSS